MANNVRPNAKFNRQQAMSVRLTANNKINHQRRQGRQGVGQVINTTTGHKEGVRGWQNVRAINGVKIKRNKRCWGMG